MIFRCAAALLLATAAVLALAAPQSGPNRQAVTAERRIDVTGDWSGTLDAGGQKLRLILHIKAAENGQLSATLDSVDQNARGIPVSAIALTGKRLEFELKVLGAKYSGTVQADGTAIEGTFTQGIDLPLRLERAKLGEAAPRAEHRRPQNPVPPFPYDQVEVTYANPSAPGVRMAGTLTVPRGEGPFPALLLITGSGPQDRDETVFGHKPFLVLADHLTRAGFAVLRSDDRGVGGSTGDLKSATSADFASDAEAGLDFLRKDGRIDPRRIGLLGHSEGGVVAPMVAARRPEVAFLVLIAPSSVPGEQILLGQGQALAQAMGRPWTPEVRELSAALYKAIARGEGESAIRAKLSAVIEAAGMPASPGMTDAQMQAITSPWFRFFLRYDPAEALARVKCPVLALFGEKDLQVLPADNVGPLRAALARGGNQHVRVEVLPGVNHLLQPAKTGLVSEYSSIEQTIDPAALRILADWLAATVAKR